MSRIPREQHLIDELFGPEIFTPGPDEREEYGIEDISLPRLSTADDGALTEITNRLSSTSLTNILRRLRQPAVSRPTPHQLPWHEERVDDAALPGYTFCTLAGVAFETTNFRSVFPDRTTGLPRVKVKKQAGGVGFNVVIGARMVLQGGRASNICWPMLPSDNPAFHELWNSNVTPVLECTGLKINWLMRTGALTFLGYEARTERPERVIVSMDMGTDILPSDLNDNCLNSKLFHLHCGPAEAVYQIEKIHRLFKRAYSNKEPPIIVWQPDSEKCVQEFRNEFIKACSLADVVIPLAIDLARVFTDAISPFFHRDVVVFKHVVEKCSKKLLNVFKPGTRNAGLKGILVVRSDAVGAFIYGHPKSFKEDPNNIAHRRARSDLAMQRRAHWLPPYYCQENRNTAYIQDRTGGDEAFVGAFCAYLAQVNEDYVQASICGIVATSFVIERVACPEITISENLEELWNGESFIHRLEAYYRDCLHQVRVPRVRVPPNIPFRTVEEYMPVHPNEDRGPDRLFLFRDPRNPVYGEEDPDDNSDSETVVHARLDQMAELGMQKPPAREVKFMKNQREREMAYAIQRSSSMQGGISTHMWLSPSEHAWPLMRFWKLNLDNAGRDFNWDPVLQSDNLSLKTTERITCSFYDRKIEASAFASRYRTNMAPKGKKKKPAANPARGVATTSLPSKAKLQQAEEEKARLAAEEEERKAAEAAAAAAEEEAAKLAATTATNAHKDVTLTPEEFAAQLEDNELQEFLERNGDKVFREARRQATKLETERRTLRATGNTGCTPFLVGDWLEEGDVERIFGIAKANEASRYVALGSDETTYTLDMWRLHHTLADLGFKETHIKEVIALGISSPDDAIEHLVLTYPEVDLPSFAVSRTPKTGQLLAQVPVGKATAKKLFAELLDNLPTDIPTNLEPALETVPTESPAFLDDDISSESEIDENMDPSVLISQYLKYRRKNAKITGIWAAEPTKRQKKKASPGVSISQAIGLTKERSEQLATLQTKLERLKADPLFDFRQAAELWEKEVEDARQQSIAAARTTKRKSPGTTTQRQNASTSRANSGSRAGSRSGDSGDEGVSSGVSGMRLDRSRSRPTSRASASSTDAGAFGTLFNGDAENEEGKTFTNTRVFVRDFGKPAEATPSSRKVLDEAVTGRYPGSKVTFRDVSTSASFQSEVYVTWPLTGALPSVFPTETDETDENGELRKDVLYSIHTLKSLDGTTITTQFKMLNISCPTKVQADFYLATIALYRLFPEEKLYLRLNSVWRGFWQELMDEAKQENNVREKRLLKWLRSTAEDIMQNALPEFDKERQDAIDDVGNSKKMFYEPLEFMTTQQLLNIYAAKLSNPMYHYMLQGRMSLPIWQYRDQLLQAINDHQITIVCGETGCGKSTQLPAFILEECLAAGQSCRIFVTEPRRISAISLAKRVCEELGEVDVGTNRSLVGYSIRLEGKFTSKTRLIYATTGIVMRMLERGNNLREITHLILDEVHERSIESDFLLLVLKKLLAVRQDLKVILMSATVDAQKFSEYLDDAPIFSIPGRTYPVQTYYLEDAVELTRFVLPDDSARGNRRRFDDYDLDDVEETGPNSTSNYEGYSGHTRKTMARFDEWTINYELIVQLLIEIATNPAYVAYSRAVLVFLPGLNEIRRLHNAILGDPNLQQGWEVHALHSTIATEEQEQAFLLPPEGTRKVVLATNIAETGITIPDITCVIDTCKSKEMRFDEKRQLSRLIETFISKANAKQRRGRAGRVQEGLCFHLVTRERFNSYFAEQQVPEMLRLSLQDLILRIKICNLGGIEETLSLALDPPTPKNVNRAIDSLLEVKALTASEELTPLGRHLAQLPLDVYLGKLLLLSTLYGCVDVCVTIAAILSSKSPWIQPFGKREQAEIARMSWRTGDSDLLTTYYAYCGWRKSVDTKGMNSYEFCNKNYLSAKNLVAIEEMKTQLFVALADSGIMRLEQDERIRLNRARYLRRGKQQFFEVPDRYDFNSKNDLVVTSTIAAGFYPKIISREGKGWRNIVNNQSLNVSLTSVNRKSTNISWLSYYNILQSSNKYYDAYETSRVNDVALALLCGDAEFKLYAGAMIVDGNRIRFVFDSWRGTLAILILRRRIRALTSQRWRNIDGSISDDNRVWFEIAIRVLGRGKMTSKPVGVA
ncbi:ATP-dependent RNA helicase DHX29 [Drechslerella dactyloides]|uniref:RNA helicase n=1 Tax=Drechslerella dactyloides TaxID=74499 RepID=A0AAD6NHI1_DREDA|nr:ATP-dependent RNA helicase DHX29 [Drechslerella dactyloides]